MKNTTENEYQKLQQTRREYESKLQNAIIKDGGINITQSGKVINDILLASPKGFFGVDEDTLIKIELITQSVDDGSIKAYTKEYGEVHFEFDFTGNKSQCYKYLHEQEVKNKIKVAELLTNHIDRLEDKQITKGVCGV